MHVFKTSKPMFIRGSVGHRDNQLKNIHSGIFDRASKLINFYNEASIADYYAIIKYLLRILARGGGGWGQPGTHSGSSESAVAEP
jgi:hypothetical protein